MKIIALGITIALNLLAQDSDTKIGCLVGADAKMVYGVDVERYQNSHLAEVYPVWFGQNSISPLPVKKIIATLSDQTGGHSSVLILQGSSFSAQMLTAQPGQENALRTYRGYPALALSDESLLVVLNSTLAVTGETDSVSHVLDGLSSTDCTGDIVSKISDMNNSYDAWFIVLRPLEQIDLASLMPPSGRRSELAHGVLEVHGGIRVGTVHSVRVEVVTKNPDDASALAILGRWLPAMLEKEGSTESTLVGAVENFETRASGTTASLSFLLPDAAVEAAQKATQKKRLEMRADGW